MILNNMRGAVSFLTSIPAGGALTKSTARYFWLAGCVVGGVDGIVWLGASKLWPPMIASVLVVVADVGITRGLHYDAVCDLGDGFLVSASRAKRLEIMKDPRAGAFGVVTLVVYIALRIFTVSKLQLPLSAFVAVAVLSRLWMTVGLELFSSAQTLGLAALFSTSNQRAQGKRAGTVSLGILVLAVSVGAGLLFGYSFSATQAVTVVLVMIVTSFLIQFYCSKVLGGITGDVLGASAMISEVVALMTLVAFR